MIAALWFTLGVLVGVIVAAAVLLAWLLHKVNVWEE